MSEYDKPLVSQDLDTPATVSDNQVPPPTNDSPQPVHQTQPYVQPQPVPQQQPYVQPQPVPTQQPYAQPYVQPQVYAQQPLYPQNPQFVQTQPVVTNQIVLPSQVVIPSGQGLRTSSTGMVCPSCKNFINTRVETSFACCNFCCCCMTSPLCWAGFQLIRGKDLICLDAKHTCPNCGTHLGNYEAC